MIRTAVIGLGRIGWRYHVPEIVKHKDAFTLCAVVDTNQDRLAEAKETYGVSGYTDLSAMLAAEKPDLVVIASPTAFHADQAIAALESGADVLLDKPMAKDLESARRIEAAVKRTGKKLTVYQPHRFTPEAAVVRRFLASGILGEIFQIKRSNCNYVRRNDWQSFLKNGGGMLNNYGAHYIDQLLYLSGQAPVKVFCQTSRIANMGDADDVVKFVMQTEKGTILDLDINQATAIPLPMLMLFGQYGTAQVQWDKEGKLELYVRYYDPKELPERQIADGLAAPDRRYPSDQIPWKELHLPILPEQEVDYYAKCADYFSGRGEAPVLLEDTMKIMELVSLGHQLAAEPGTVTL